MSVFGKINEYNVIWAGMGQARVEFESGKVADVDCEIICEGVNRHWIEDMHPDNIGYYQDFNEDFYDAQTYDIERKDYYDLLDNQCIELPAGDKIKKLLHVIHVPAWEIKRYVV